MIDTDSTSCMVAVQEKKEREKELLSCRLRDTYLECLLPPYVLLRVLVQFLPPATNAFGDVKELGCDLGFMQHVPWKVREATFHQRQVFHIVVLCIYSAIIRQERKRDDMYKHFLVLLHS